MKITVKGRAQPPAVVVNLIRGFLQRLPLTHFVDLVLPQMVPVCSPAQAAGSKFPGSQLIRDLWVDRDHGNFVQEPEIKIMRLFQSHAGIEHLTVNWNGHPLLLFADLEAKDYARVTQYQYAKAVTTLRQNVTMGLKKGNTVLIHYQYNGVLYQAILMMSGSVPGGKGGVDTHKLWKHVLPRSTEFAWLSEILSRPSAYQRCNWMLTANMAHSCNAHLLKHQGQPSQWIKFTLLVTAAVLVNWKFSSICQLKGCALVVVFSAPSRTSHLNPAVDLSFSRQQ